MAAATMGALGTHPLFPELWFQGLDQTLRLFLLLTLSSYHLAPDIAQLGMYLVSGWRTEEGCPQEQESNGETTEAELCREVTL